NDRAYGERTAALLVVRDVRLRGLHASRHSHPNSDPAGPVLRRTEPRFRDGKLGPGIDARRTEWDLQDLSAGQGPEHARVRSQRRAVPRAPLATRVLGEPGLAE